MAKKDPVAHVPFEGFPKGAFTFFRQLAKNNDRDWFAPRKADYETLCKQPMEALAGQLNLWFLKHAVEYASADPRKNVQRIYRDTRFAKDKTPYKTHVACFFSRKGFAKNAGPDFYIQVNHESVGIAGGLYMPGPDELKAIRTAIASDTKGFEKAFCNKPLASRLGEPRGAELTRLPKGFDNFEDSPAEKWLRRKQFFFWKEFPASLAADRHLVKELTTSISLLLPACEWLTSALRAATKDDDNRPKRPAPMF